MTAQFILKSFTVQNIAYASDLLKAAFSKDFSKEQIKEQITIFRYPTKIKKITVLNSPHVHKKAREQFETRTHKMQISINGLDHSQMDKMLQFVQSIQLLGVQLQLRTIETTELY